MARDWLGRAKLFVEEVTRDLPADASLTARRKLLRQVGWRFHGGTFWGRRQYGKACRAYLERHGQPRRVAPPSPDGLFAADIIFPFRGL
jgi:hypothetical protein